MKTYLIGAAAFVAGYAICKAIYTEKALRAYQMGWDESKEEQEDQARLNRIMREETLSEKAERTVEETREAVVQAEKDRRESVSKSVEETKALLDHIGYDQISKKDKPKPPKGPTVTAVVDEPSQRIISQQEFFDRGLETQYQITYYAGDDVLVGQSGKPIDEEARITAIGPNALSQFGVESEDENVVYVRNHVMGRGQGVDFEITRDWGNYSDTVPNTEVEPA